LSINKVKYAEQKGKISSMKPAFIELVGELNEFDGDYFEFYLRKKAELSKGERKVLKSLLKSLPPKTPPRIELYCEDVRNYEKVVDKETVDWIITDPPYSKKFLDLYDTLAELSLYALKPGGALIVMTGQSYLPEVINKLQKHLNYVWTLAYLTPGGQSPYLWKVRCNTFWKPVLVFSKGKYSGDAFGDVIKTSPNNNDKRFHFWGQSEEGFEQIFDKFVFPGQTVLDPFVGGGTTAVVALKRGCNFIGIDKDPECIETTKRRIEDVFRFLTNKT